MCGHFFDNLALNAPSYHHKAGDDGWLEWFFVFEAVAGSAKWNDETKRLKLAASMRGRAAALVTDILLDEAGMTYKDLKTRYAERLSTVPGSLGASTSFSSCRQRDQEDEIAWHARSVPGNLSKRLSRAT